MNFHSTGMESKTCIFIIGTNGTGKTTLAKRIIESVGGGILSTTKEYTLLNNPKMAFVGSYDAAKKYGGVDGLNKTRVLRGIVEKLHASRPVVFCEGFFLNTFGDNLQNAMWVADNRYVVFLYASPAVINNRLYERSGRAVNESILTNQKAAFASALRWKKVGVKVVPINTGECTIEQELQIVKEKILNGLL